MSHHGITFTERHSEKVFSHNSNRDKKGYLKILTKHNLKFFVKGSSEENGQTQEIHSIASNDPTQISQVATFQEQNFVSSVWPS